MIRVLYYPFLLLMELYVYRKYKDYFHPMFITYGIWLIMPLLYDMLCLTTQGYHVLTNLFFGAVMIFLAVFSLVFIIANKATSRTSYRIKARLLQMINFRVLVVFTIFINFVYIYSICRVCDSFDLVYVVQRYRVISLTSPHLISPWTSFFELCSYLIIPIFVCTLVYQRKSSKIVITIVFLLYFIVPIFVASKAGLLKRAVIFIICFLAKKKQKKMGIIVVLLFISALLLFLIVSRDNVKVSGNGWDSLGQYMFGYIFSPFPAYDMLLNGDIITQTVIPGERSFYFFFLLLAKLGVCGRPIDYRDMYQVPIPGGKAYTNVFSGMGPYYMDFGAIGIIIYASLLGLLFGFLYKKYKYKGNIFYRMIYIILAYGLIFQYFGDMIFVYIVTTVTDVLVTIVVVESMCGKERFIENKEAWGNI